MMRMLLLSCPQAWHEAFANMRGISAMRALMEIRMVPIAQRRGLSQHLRK
jgi:hypothetical protein